MTFILLILMSYLQRMIGSVFDIQQKALIVENLMAIFQPAEKRRSGLPVLSLNSKVEKLWNLSKIGINYQCGNNLVGLLKNALFIKNNFSFIYVCIRNIVFNTFIIPVKNRKTMSYLCQR